MTTKKALGEAQAEILRLRTELTMALDHAGEVREDVRRQLDAEARAVVEEFLAWVRAEYVPPERVELLRRARALVGR